MTKKELLTGTILAGIIIFIMIISSNLHINIVWPVYVWGGVCILIILIVALNIILKGN